MKRILVAVLIAAGVALAVAGCRISDPSTNPFAKCPPGSARVHGAGDKWVCVSR